MKFTIVFFISVLFSVWSYGSEDSAKLLGVFSNGADNFSAAKMVINKQGYACILGAVDGYVGQWIFNPTSSVLTISFSDPDSAESVSYEYLFDPAMRRYTYIYPANRDYIDQKKIFAFETDKLPKMVRDAFKEFHAEQKKSSKPRK